MSGWIQSSLTDTIETLRNVGLIDLASDMERILECGDIEKLRVFRSKELEALAAALPEVDHDRQLVSVLRRLSQTLSLKHATIHVVQESDSLKFNPKVMTTYPQNWIDRYVERNYARIDPVFPYAAQHDEGFFWDIIGPSNPMVNSFFRDAGSYGIGPSGYTYPMQIASQVKVAISVTSDLQPSEFRKYFEPLLPDFELIAEDLVLAFCEFAEQELSPLRVPQDRTLRLLHGLAQGRTLREMAEKMDVGSIESETQMICEFYEARTLIQAAMACARLGHLDNLAFDHWEIASDEGPEGSTAQV